ncbi:MAG: thioredoxin family protein [Candidatus Jordarchaeum sp.]|uniref:thioredoxin family protein n=1 Tax=Candidatus Jordarchaeum sp. TaxID=2823881 RepID=UPI00404B998D
MKIEILGTGCSKCRLTEKRVKEVVEELGRKDIEIIKVEDIAEIMKHGVMMTPALAIDGVVKISGRIARKEEIKEMIGG